MRRHLVFGPKLPRQLHHAGWLLSAPPSLKAAGVTDNTTMTACCCHGILKKPLGIFGHRNQEPLTDGNVQLFFPST